MSSTTADYTAVPIDEMEAVYGGGFKRARGALGVEAFGISVSDLPPGFDRVSAHSHRFDGQEEIYLALRGSGELEIGGLRVPVDDETIVRVGPTAVRRPIAGSEGIRLLSVGATPGKPYVPFGHHNPGAPEKPIAELPGVMEAAAGGEAEGDPDFESKRLDDFDKMSGYFDGVTMTPVRRELGISAFGVNVVDLEPTATEYPRHDHAADGGQEEVYIPLRGSGTLDLGELGTVEMTTGMMVRVAAETERQMMPGPDGLRFIALGGKPGKAYEPR